MRFAIAFIVCGFCVLVFSGLSKPSSSPIGVERAIAYFDSGSRQFASSALRLQTAISAISPKNPATIIKARKALRDCRQHYKRLEFFIAYFFKSAAVFFNGPPKFEVEEPYMEWQTPTGLQVMESLLYEKNVASKKVELTEQIDAVTSSANDLHSLLYGFAADDKQILESVRLELVRIYTLGITGFDAPVLKSGIEESHVALSSIQYILRPYLERASKSADSVRYYLSAGLQVLRESKSFDAFDRLEFLTRYGLPLQHSISLLINELHLFQNTSPALNYDAGNLFSPDAINLDAFPNSGMGSNALLAALGKKLFFEKGLSGNNKISCATCHNPVRHFSDALPKSIAFDGHSSVQRNAPSLFYAGFQHSQLWEGRAKSIEEQVKMVINNPAEMNGNYAASVQRLYTDETYKRLFKQAFVATEDSLITADRIAASIAVFVRRLAPFNSPFDKYMQGNKTAITPGQKRGFNLFMGKAQCGTCHFAPLFNGLVPPLYNLTELEVVGTPATDDFTRPKPDADRGRYAVFPIDFYEQAFKTPTVRNASATAPYMHNGAFRTLEKVVEFYNKGGGNGLGLNVKNQTLSSTPLQLTDVEVKAIVSFMHSLKDSVSY
ncbi:MAG TPA: cytochrome c peroxidase [Flavisolibacter sp.]|nr:cytochrome c peroxidase [Flavisolibacter sp.]